MGRLPAHFGSADVTEINELLGAYLLGLFQTTVNWAWQNGIAMSLGLMILLLMFVIVLLICALIYQIVRNCRMSNQEVTTENRSKRYMVARN